MILLYKKNNKYFVESAEGLTLTQELDGSSDFVFAEILMSSEYDLISDHQMFPEAVITQDAQDLGLIAENPPDLDD